jgi:peptidylprolyl isomerase
MNQKNNIMVVVVMVVCAALVFGIATWLGPNDTSTSTKQAENTDQKEITAPLNAEQLAAYQVTMTNEKNPVAKLTTNQGVIELELFQDTMPITTGNFIKLAKEGFYDGVKFHRVIKDFMIQSGDPITKTEEYLRYGTGGPEYTIPDEHIAGEYLTNVRGTIAMANRGPETGGSQFFINLVNNTALDFDKEPFSSKHPVFGRVLNGMGVVDAIAEVEVNQNNLPLEAVVIEKVEIMENN